MKYGNMSTTVVACPQGERLLNRDGPAARPTSEVSALQTALVWPTP